MTARTAVVTGATRGIGRSTALALARRGLDVVLTHRGDPAATDEVVSTIRDLGRDAVAVRLDVGDADSVREFAAEVERVLAGRWGGARLDVLVNNAGIGLFAPVESVTVDDFDAMMATNVRGPFLVIQALLPHLSHGARIVNVSTSLTRHVGPATSVYSASKAALEALSRSLATELGPRGIRINTIAPGPTGTDFNGGAQRDDPGMRALIAERTALGRVGEQDEIADAIAALTGDDMRWVTAERIEVSGGSFL